MMKKKMHDQEEKSDNNNHKTIDNKEFTDNPATVNGKYTGTDVSDVSTDQASDHITGEDSSSDKVVSEVRVVEEKLAEMQDKYIRLSAEFDNYRKRTLREKMDLSKYAGENLLVNIIPLMDDFERAIQHMESTTDCEAMKNGIDLIYNKFSEFLKQNGVKEIESMNNAFNVDMHEAVAKIPVEEDDKKGKVLDVVLKGYYLQDKVLRFAKVVVGE